MIQFMRGRFNRLKGSNGAAPGISALLTAATLPLQWQAIARLLPAKAVSAAPGGDPAPALAMISIQGGDIASLLLFLMLVGASAFLLVRLKRKWHRLGTPALRAIILERTLELQRFRQMLSKAERMANVGSWEHEPATGRFVWSDQLFRIFGFQPAEAAPGKDMRLELIHPDDREEFLRCERESVKTGRPYELKFRIRRPDGVPRVLLHRVEPEVNGDGRLVRRIGTVRDITDTEATEETFRLMFEQTPYPFMVIDENGIVDCNPATLRMFGRSREAMLGHHPGEFSPLFQPDGRASDEKAHDMVARAYHDGFNRFEWIHRLPDGTDFPAEINLSTMKIGGRINLMVVMHDLRERHREELRVRRMKELETINRLGATLSHEFNTPLAVIRTSSEMMAMKTGDNPEVGTFLGKILTHVGRIRELVDKLHRLRELKEIDYAAGMKILDLHETGNGMPSSGAGDPGSVPGDPPPPAG